MSGNKSHLTAQARRLLHVLTVMFREQELLEVSISDRALAKECNFPSKFLRVAVMQIDDAKLLRITRGKNRATYAPINTGTQEAEQNDSPTTLQACTLQNRQAPCY